MNSKSVVAVVATNNQYFVERIKQTCTYNWRTYCSISRRDQQLRPIFRLIIVFCHLCTNVPRLNDKTLIPKSVSFCRPTEPWLGSGLNEARNEPFVVFSGRYGVSVSSSSHECDVYVFCSLCLVSQVGDGGRASGFRSSYLGYFPKSCINLTFCFEHFKLMGLTLFNLRVCSTCPILCEKI